MRQGVWDRPAGRPITPLDGETAGLVGLGAIGQALARRLQPFGLRVIAYDPYVEEHPARELGVRMVGDLQTELVHDFFDGFASGARANVHVKVLYGRSSHHHIEAVFKAFARALRVACAKDARLAKMLPSTKGLL